MKLYSETFSTRESSITNDQILALLRPKKEFVHAQSMVERRSKRRACISGLDSEQMTRLSLVMCILSGVKILCWVSRTNGKSPFSLLFMGSTVSRRVPWLIPSFLYLFYFCLFLFHKQRSSCFQNNNEELNLFTIPHYKDQKVCLSCVTLHQQKLSC